ELIHPAFAHPDEGGLLRQPMLLRQEHVPRVPHFALRVGVGCGKRDVEPALEQLDLRLRLVVPVAALPGPGVARRRGFWNDDDASRGSAIPGACLFLRGWRNVLDPEVE